MVEASGAALKSNIQYSADHSFPLENIPFGVFENPTGGRHVCTRIGDFIIDLSVLLYHGAFGGPLFSNLTTNCFDKESINEFMSLGKDYWHEARITI